MSITGNGSAPRWWRSMWWRSRESEQGFAAYRRLAMQLHYDLQGPESPRSVLLATPKSCSVCARGSAALACCLAEELGRPVLLVDASPRQPDVTRMLDCGARSGLVNLLADHELKLDDLVVPTTQENAFFLPAGTGFGRSFRPASADAVIRLLNAAGGRYDFILIFGGSVLDDSMAMTMAPHVGCVLLLAVEKQTTVEDLDAAQDALASCKARKIGLVLTTPLRGRRWSMKGARGR